MESCAMELVSMATTQHTADKTNIHCLQEQLKPENQWELSTSETSYILRNKSVTEVKFIVSDETLSLYSELEKNSSKLCQTSWVGSRCFCKPFLLILQTADRYK